MVKGSQNPSGQDNKIDSRLAHADHMSSIAQRRRRVRYCFLYHLLWAILACATGYDRHKPLPFPTKRPDPDPWPVDEQLTSFSCIFVWQEEHRAWQGSNLLRASCDRAWMSDSADERNGNRQPSDGALWRRQIRSGQWKEARPYQQYREKGALFVWWCRRRAEVATSGLLSGSPSYLL